MINAVKIILIDRRGCRITAGYYKTIEVANKWFERVVYDQYWKNNTIEVVDAFIEPIGDF